MQDVFNNISGLLFIGAGIVTIIGLCRIYFLWNTGRHDNIEQEIIRWAGGIFLFLLAATISTMLFM